MLSSMLHVPNIQNSSIGVSRISIVEI